ncbi:MAG: response regulator [Chloroflexi bacterium]|nr:response regulator [Chloroflexota bacterium]MCY3697517.1 response regulator [Chloroflexota bacterium]
MDTGNAPERVEPHAACIRTSEALRLLEERQPQLVLLDLVLPDTDGFELIGEMLKIEDVPVTFLSAYGRDELIAQAFEQAAAALRPG